MLAFLGNFTYITQDHGKNNFRFTPAGLAAGTLVGCGEGGVEQEAQITGFGTGVDVQIVEDQWIVHEGKQSLPGDTIRNVHDYDKFAGCKEVANGYFSLNFDDPECWSDFWCQSTEDTHCEAQYQRLYDYERLEEVTVKDCPAFIALAEYKPKVSERNEECIANIAPPQRLRETTRYVIRVSTQNPEYEEKPDEPEHFTTTHDITAHEWSTVGYETPVKVRIKGDRITSVSLDE